MAKITLRTVMALMVLVLKPAVGLAATCDALPALSLRSVSVTRTEVVPAGKFSLPVGADTRGIDMQLLPKHQTRHRRNGNDPNRLYFS